MNVAQTKARAGRAYVNWSTARLLCMAHRMADEGRSIDDIRNAIDKQRPALEQSLQTVFNAVTIAAMRNEACGG